MSAAGASAGRATPLLLGLLAASLAGCQSPTPSAHSAAGLKAAGENMVAAMEAGRYGKACAGFTPKAQRLLTLLPSGCVGTLAFARGLAAVEGKPRIGQTFRERLAKITPSLQISGDAAIHHGSVEARYEAGRWRFEGHEGVASGVRPTVKASLERAILALGEQGSGMLVEGVMPGAP